MTEVDGQRPATAPGARKTAPALRGVRRGARRLRYRLARTKRRLGSSFQRELEDPEVPLSLDMGAKSGTLLVAFGGMHGEVGMPPFEFFGVTGGMPVKRLFVRDLRQAWYHKGIEGHGKGIVEAAESLKALISEHGVQRLVVTGSSAGGYAALAFGTLLRADTVLAFGPQTVIDPTTIAAIGDHRWDEPLGELETAGVLDPAWTDLREALRRERGTDPGTRYEVYFSHVNTRPNTGYGRDRKHAERLRGLEGVRLYRFGSGGHMIARRLREAGVLDGILRRALLPGENPLQSETEEAI
jgi:pimeloyl-ACP methyl ester carboxylesterase